MTSLSPLKKALKFLLDPQTDFESFKTKRNFFKSIVWFCRSQRKINLEMKPKSWKVNFCWKAVVTEFPVSVFLFTIFWTIWFIIRSCQSIFLSKWRSKSSKASFWSKTVPTNFAHFTLFSTIFSIRLIIVLMSINYFFRNEGRSSQKKTFSMNTLQWPFPMTRLGLRSSIMKSD